jgi:hypothetical protein
LFVSSGAKKVAAQNDGSLKIDSTILTNQISGTGDLSEFPIRGQLFSPMFDGKIKERKQETQNITNLKQTIDFQKNADKQLHNLNTDEVKMNLFKNYSNQNISMTTSKQDGNKNEWLIVAFLSLPLLFLTGFVAKHLTRRKKRHERTD